MTIIIDSIEKLREVQNSVITSKRFGFVPTMGNLHEGHKSLLQQSKKENDLTLLSIFVNPTQFNNPEDFNHYPKTLEEDIALAEKEKIDFIFLPTYEMLYPDAYQYVISHKENHKLLEGGHRPGHFDGVLTVVMKLLLLVKATRAYFGEKDYEQLTLVKGLVKAFFIDTEIVECTTKRNTFGLPLSSRNNRLNAEEYALANEFARIFHSDTSCDEIKNSLQRLGIKIDYIEEVNNRRFAAVYVGKIRLIDNILVGHKK